MQSQKLSFLDKTTNRQSDSLFFLCNSRAIESISEIPINVSTSMDSLHGFYFLESFNSRSQDFVSPWGCRGQKEH